uniref:Uncharacterized protein n=1 Tax=Labrus bergylta TaxID=56723 RepID=A0A3Q3GXC4_9LABR
SKKVVKERRKMEERDVSIFLVSSYHITKMHPTMTKFVTITRNRMALQPTQVFYLFINNSELEEDVFRPPHQALIILHFILYEAPSAVQRK